MKNRNIFSSPVLAAGLVIYSLISATSVYAETNAEEEKTQQSEAKPVKNPPPALSPEKQAELNDQLLYRITVGRADDVKILLSRGADPDVADSQGVPAITIAAERWDVESTPMVKALVDGGANLSFPNNPLMNPLIIAVKTEKPEMVAYLIEHGAEYYISDENGQPLRQLAASVSQEVLAPIAAAIKADEERLRQLRSNENLNKLIDQLTFGHCAAQYLTYYLKSGQDDLEETEPVEEAIDLYKEEALKAHGKLRELFDVTNQELEGVGKKCREVITQMLDDMVSNRNRKKLGVGTRDDLNRRCTIISDRWYARVVEEEEKMISREQGPEVEIVEEEPEEVKDKGKNGNE